MAKLEIPVQVYMDNLDEMIDELKQLQTYAIKLYGCDEKGLVDCDEVVKIFRKHLRTKVGKPEIIYCKNCAYRCENWISTNVDGDVIHHCTQLDQMVDDDFYCGYAERKKE